MKELRRNMRLIGALLLCLFIGAGGWFGYTTWTQGARWAMSSSNTRLNRAKNSVVMGTITDRDSYAGTVSQLSPDSSTMNQVVASIGDDKLTNAEFQIYYWMQFYNMANMYGEYLTYMGLDKSSCRPASAPASPLTTTSIICRPT